MKWTYFVSRLFILSLLVGLCANSAQAQTRRYHSPYLYGGVYPGVVYVIDITPRPAITRGLTGSNVPPYNSIFDGPKRFPAPVRHHSTAPRRHAVYGYWKTPTSKPLLIVNPYYKGN